jgi:hypothetical protein
MTNSKTRGVVAIICLVASTTCSRVRAEGSRVETQTRSGKVYDGEYLSGSSFPEALYSISLVTETGNGVDRLRSFNTDRRGRQFFVQTVDFDGATPKAYTFSNVAAKQDGKLTVTATELIMELTEDGKTKTAREARPPLFAVGPSISRIVERHIDELVAGRSITFRMVAVNKLQTFALRVLREAKRPNEPIPQLRTGQWILLRTEPESAVARMFAPKILTIVDAKTGRTVFVSGPVPSPAPGVGMLKRGTIHYED